MRNQAKRRIRAAASALLPGLEPGWDLVFIARQPICTARFTHVEEAIRFLARRAGALAIDRDDGERPAA